MLASYRFTHSTMNGRGESRTYQRELHLSESIMKYSGHYCSNCLREIKLGETIASTTSFTRLCQDCYGNMPQAMAQATVTTDGIGCVSVIYTTFKNVIIHDFKDCAVIVSDSGALYRFRDTAEAQACVDAALVMAAGGARGLSILNSVSAAGM